jgi:putative ABC transport system substrate-binding protein
MKRKVLIFFCLLPTVLLLTVSLLEAQQTEKVHRIGYLSTRSSSPATPGQEAFRHGLRDLGYIEGKNIVLEYRFAEGERDRLPELAADLVRIQVDAIFATGTRATRAAKNATSTIPIIVGGAGDLVGTGLVASIARPGGNITGSTRMSTDLVGKRIELLKEAVSKVSRVAVIWSTRQDGVELREMESPARQLGVKVQPVKVREPNEFQSGYAMMVREQTDALIILHSGFAYRHRRRLLELAAINRLPSMCETARWTKSGCLISYGPDRLRLYRRAAYLVDKILKGAKPGDLPIEQPTKFELIINLKTAKKLDFTVPPSVLYRADKVIK